MGGFCPGGFCPGGFCPGGFCPRTLTTVFERTKVLEADNLWFSSD